MTIVQIKLEKEPGIKNWYRRMRMPKNVRMMLYCLHECAIKNDNYYKFRCMLSHINNRMISKGFDMELPRYWGMLGEYPEWQEIIKIVNKWGYLMHVNITTSDFCSPSGRLNVRSNNKN